MHSLTVLYGVAEQLGRPVCELWNQEGPGGCYKPRAAIYQNPQISRSHSSKCKFSLEYLIVELRFSSIDGVLLRSSKPLPGASETLHYLQAHRIPFILLTNGGGKTEAQRVADLSKYLDVPIDETMFVQSHTPFTQLVEGHRDRTELKDGCVLVLGGEGNGCRHVAEK